MSKIKELKEIAEKLRRLEVEYSKLSWTQYTTGFDFGAEESYEKIMNFYQDEKNYETILKYKDMDLDYRDKRQFELMYNDFKPYHLSKELNELQVEIEKKTNELSKILNTHRTIFEGKETTSVEISNIIMNDENRERRKAAYFSRNQINKPLVDGGFIELINLRSEYAKLYGAKDFVELKLEMEELSTTIFDGWESEIHQILPKMNNERRKFAEKFLNDDKIMPWDEGYIGSRIAPMLNTEVDMSRYYETIRDFFIKFGIDIAKYNITYDIFSRSNKSEWGYNFTIDEGKDSRILANVKNRYYEYGVLLHETGHGVHSFSLDPDETILNMGVNGIISEGIANLFGHFIYNPIFYKQFFKDADEAEKQFSNIREFNKLNSLRAIKDIFFDHALYRNKLNSLQDINNLYSKVGSEILNEEPFEEEAPWGFRIHYTTHPIYLHNYFMGDVTCEMLSKVFSKKYGVESIAEKPAEFGEFLINEVIKPSGLYKYEELFKKISGEDFSLKYMID